MSRKAAIAIIIRTDLSFDSSSWFPMHKTYFLINSITENAAEVVLRPAPITPPLTLFYTLDDKSE